MQAGNLVRYKTVRNSPSSVLLLRGRKRTHSDSSTSMDEHDELSDTQQSTAAKLDFPNQQVSETALRLARNSYKTGDLPVDSSSSMLSPNSIRGGHAKLFGTSNDAAPLIQPLVRNLSTSGVGNSSGGIRNFFKGGPSNRYFDIQKLYSAAPFLSNSGDPSRAERGYFSKSQDQNVYGGVLAISGGGGVGQQEEDFFPDDAKEGLLNVRATTLLLLWYFFSFCTLFLNKYILSFLQGEPTLLGKSQCFLSLSVVCLLMIIKHCFTIVLFRRCPNGVYNMLWIHSNVYSVWIVSTS